MKSLSRGHFHPTVRLGIVAVCMLALLSAVAMPTTEGYAQSTQTPWQNLTSSQLTAVWWKWVLSIPAARSPLVDTTGANAASDQPYYGIQTDGLFFLTGTFVINELENGDTLGEATRSISVKQGTAFFFPLLNAEFDNTCFRPSLGGNCLHVSPFPQVLGVPAMQAIVAAQEDSASHLFATFTPSGGVTQNLSYQRLQSPPFSYDLPAVDNIYQTLFGVNVKGTVAPAVSDGFWTLIPGMLTPGNYELRFGGTAPITSTAKFIEEITYHITITP
jgi:hypothetical protein